MAERSLARSAQEESPEKLVECFRHEGEDCPRCDGSKVSWPENGKAQPITWYKRCRSIKCSGIPPYRPFPGFLRT